ncbi:hypothetical protein HS7_19840 [Sulfolobales archaeon HS-7]|nr:hypothetical protein HS7_19840 [Sulfolobales archaeon HS-7]
MNRTKNEVFNIISSKFTEDIAGYFNLRKLAKEFNHSGIPCIIALIEQCRVSYSCILKFLSK